MQALGTRFGVRELSDGSRVDLYEGRLRVTPLHGAAVQMKAGDSLLVQPSAEHGVGGGGTPMPAVGPSTA